MKADDKVAYTDEDGREKMADFTEFEHLKAKVDVLEEMLNEMAEILRQNNLARKVDAPVFDAEEVIRRISN